MLMCIILLVSIADAYNNYVTCKLYNVVDK